MIVRRGEKVLVQGITGKQGTFWTEKMIGYGATVVGGVNPKKAGTEHLGLPVIAAAKDMAGGFDISVMFIPPMAARAAAVDACEAGAKLLVCLTEHIPSHDFQRGDLLRLQHASRHQGEQAEPGHAMGDPLCLGPASGIDRRRPNHRVLDQLVGRARTIEGRIQQRIEGNVKLAMRNLAAIRAPTQAGNAQHPRMSFEPRRKAVPFGYVKAQSRRLLQQLADDHPVTP